MKEFFVSPLFNPQIDKLREKNTILGTNEKAFACNLQLTEKDAQMLVNAGKEAISIQDRIEFGKSATVKIIEKFMYSTYISQNDYADTIAALIDVFYEVKEESLDVLTDEEVIDAMFDCFELESGGDIEVLQNRDMEYLCRKIRYMSMRIIDADYNDGGENINE